MSQLFTGLCFAFSGTLSQSKQQLEQLVKVHGAEVSLKITPGETTHLITTKFEFDNRTRQVYAARQFNSTCAGLHVKIFNVAIFFLHVRFLLLDSLLLIHTCVFDDDDGSSTCGDGELPA